MNAGDVGSHAVYPLASNVHEDRLTGNWKHLAHLLQVLYRKIHDDLSISCRRNEAVMLFSSYVCHWLEPVSIMSGAVLGSPFFHCNSNGVGNIKFKVCTALDCFL